MNYPEIASRYLNVTFTIKNQKSKVFLKNIFEKIFFHRMGNKWK